MDQFLSQTNLSVFVIPLHLANLNMTAPLYCFIGCRFDLNFINTCSERLIIR